MITYTEVPAGYSSKIRISEELKIKSEPCIIRWKYIHIGIRMSSELKSRRDTKAYGKVRRAHHAT